MFIVAYINANKKENIYYISHASGHIESRPHWTPLFPTGTGTFLGVWGNRPSDFQGFSRMGELYVQVYPIEN